ncbi:MAG: hypothetical protein K8W52_25400 [Deltaproteobacteria bacterium]|nr:hypothetical protein [Deltaproteobacteria bacterium]
MPRRRNPQDSVSATPTKPDPTRGSRTPAAPRLPSAPRLPATPLVGARPGRRADATSETAMTQRLDKVPIEPTPAPLPPSPAAADAERWFEQLPTTPGAPRKDPSAVREVLRTPAVGAPVAAPQPRAWVLPALLVATALTVGMVLGALMFGRGSAPATCPPCPTLPR